MKEKGFGPAPELYPSDSYRVVHESLPAWTEPMTSGNLSSANKNGKDVIQFLPMVPN